MKKTLLLALIAFSGISAKAQKIELGLNGGVTPYIYADQTVKNFNGTVKKEMGYYGSFRVALNLPGIQVGAGIDKFRVGVNSTTTTYNADTKFDYLTPYLFLNKKISLPKSYIYMGINGGMNFGIATTKGSGLGFPGVNKSNYSGFNGGAQAGYTINLVKGLGANIEAGARYLHIQYKTVAGVKGATVDHIAFPVSLGIRYTL